MRKVTKYLLILFLGACISFIDNSTEAEAATKDSLINKIQSQTNGIIAREYYTDFDGDGRKELFAITGPKEGPNQIWYAGSKQVKCLMNDGAAVYDSQRKSICKVSRKQKLFIAECGAFGSGSYSKCYYVKAGKVYEVKRAGEGLAQISGKKFAVHLSAFDAMRSGDTMAGHTYKAYYLKWTGKAFKEYKAKKITTKKLKKYKGSEKILRQINNLGYKVKSIYYRSNGLIHINVVKTSGLDKIYNNVTLKVRSKKVFLVSHTKKGSNILEKSGYGGIYKASGFERMK